MKSRRNRDRIFMVNRRITLILSLNILNRGIYRKSVDNTDCDQEKYQQRKFC